MDKCKGKTKNGEPCKNNASENGYCFLHSPDKMKEKAKIQENKKTLEEIINSIILACERKGWGIKLSDIDERTYKCASLKVWRYFQQEYREEQVVGILDLEITSDNNLSLGMQKTSFYGYGIDNLFTSIKNSLKNEGFIKDKKQEKDDIETSISIVKDILNRFDRAARQMKKRYNNRVPIIIEDEYDTQDLLHVILKCYFDDVRPEDYTPSYAGSSSKVDFLLKKEKIVIEVKYATKKLKDKQIGEQLIIDINRYKKHPDCKNLICFVYDPDGNIRNPFGLENDLSGDYENGNLKVFVIVNPK